MSDQAARVAVLLCTFNGEKYIREQINSIALQSHPKIDLYISDDGSSDSTLEVIKDCASNWIKGKFRIFQGPKQGYSKNFLSLLERIEISADYYAFSDQDDIWLEKKVERSLAKMTSDGPFLYCSSTKLITHDKLDIGFSSPVKRDLGFKNALIQNVAGGNTMLFNNAVRQAFIRSRVRNVVSHDWWIYMLTTAVGGDVFYDNEPQLLYRQHGENVVGTDKSLRFRCKRINRLCGGGFGDWVDKNNEGLKLISGQLCEPSKAVFNDFLMIKSSSLFVRLKGFFRSGVYRQRRAETVLLFIAIFFKKI